MERKDIKKKEVESKKDSDLEQNDEIEIKNSSSFLLKIIVGIILVFGIISFMLYFNNNNQQINNNYNYTGEYDYNGFKCSSIVDYTTCSFYIDYTHEEHRFDFRKSPYDVEKINVSGGNISELFDLEKTQQIYFTFPGNYQSDKNNNLYGKLAIGMYDVTKLVNLFRYQNLSEVAILKDTAKSEDYPDMKFIDCNNATNKTAVVIFEYSDQNKIVKNDNCYHIYATTGDNMIAVSDRFAYGLLGIVS
jgi:hypothetical protein